MPNDSTRPPVRIRFRMNIETGETEFIIDDASPDRSEEYHKKVAQASAHFLDRNPEIRDAGPIRYRFDQESQASAERHVQRDGRDEQDTLSG